LIFLILLGETGDRKAQQRVPARSQSGGKGLRAGVANT